MIVIDTNIMAYRIFRTDFSQAVLQLYNTDSSWEVPVLWRSEFLNVVTLYLRKKLINYEEAIRAVDFAQSIIQGHEHNVSPHLSLELIAASRCSSYACEFVALAKNLGARLITYDKQILSEFPAIAIKPEDYLAQL